MESERKRLTISGRWLPLFFFVWNIFSWMLFAIKADASHLLWLALMPILFVPMYVYLTRKSSNARP